MFDWFLTDRKQEDFPSDNIDENQQFIQPSTESVFKGIVHICKYAYLLSFLELHANADETVMVSAAVSFLAYTGNRWKS